MRAPRLIGRGQTDRDELRVRAKEQASHTRVVGYHVRRQAAFFELMTTKLFNDVFRGAAACAWLGQLTEFTQIADLGLQASIRHLRHETPASRRIRRNFSATSGVSSRIPGPRSPNHRLR